MFDSREDCQFMYSLRSLPSMAYSMSPKLISVYLSSLRILHREGECQNFI